jgi:hypothetical protein
MSYGDTYERETQEQSLVKKLVDCFGYNREHLTDIEIETKIDVSNIYSLSVISPSNEFLKIAERLEIPLPYVRDKILEASYNSHLFYARIDESKKKLESAFVEVKVGGSIRKLKLKGETKVLKKNGVYILERKEEHIPMDDKDLIPAVAKIIRENPLPIIYAGIVHKYSKECFMFNPLSGRIFVLSSGFCKNEKSDNTLSQLEVEYYGQINGYQNKKSAEEELIQLTHRVLKKFPKHLHPRASKLTKLEWLIRQDNQFKHYQVL